MNDIVSIDVFFDPVAKAVDVHFDPDMVEIIDGLVNIGIKGDPGPQGVPGPQGIQGVKGDTGAASTVPGPQGPKGDKGNTGAASTVPGPQGPTGPQGAASTVPGPQGPQGLPGEVPEAPMDGQQYAREDGTWTVVEATGGGGASVTVSDTAPVGAANGDLWWESDTGITYVFYVDGTSSQWVATSIKGDKGDKGDTGSQGPIGLTGPQGIQGVKGDTGSQGPQGIKGDTGATGADSTVPGPQGPQGIQGIQGVKGDKGDTGATGPAGADGAGAPGTAPPIMDGTATVGTSLLFSRQDHIHPSDTTREVAGQVVTNYDTFPFKSGSFYSMPGATAEPLASQHFFGFCYVHGTDPSVIMLEGRKYDGVATIGPAYVRHKASGGGWSAWAQQPGSSADLDARYVNATGDSMSGLLSINTVAAGTRNDLTVVGPDASGAVLALSKTGVGGKTWYMGHASGLGGSVVGEDLTLYAGAIGPVITYEMANGNMHIMSAVASSSPTTGALTVAGGIGVAGRIHVGGNVIIKDVTQTLPATGLADLRIAGVTQTTLAGQGGIELTVADGYGWKMQQLSASGAQLSFGVRNNAAAWTEKVRFTSAGDVNILNGTASTSTSTGALTVAGGVGISGTVNIAGNIGVGAAPVFYTTAAQLVVHGSSGLVIDGNATPQLNFTPSSGATKTAQFFQSGDAMNFGAAGAYSLMNMNLGASLAASSVNVMSSAAATSHTTGAMTIGGGLGVGMQIYAGTNIRVGFSTNNGYLYFGNTETKYLNFDGTTFNLGGGGLNIVNAGITTASGAVFNGNVAINNSMNFSSVPGLTPNIVRVGALIDTNGGRGFSTGIASSSDPGVGYTDLGYSLPYSGPTVNCPVAAVYGLNTAVTVNLGNSNAGALRIHCITPSTNGLVDPLYYCFHAIGS